MKLILWCVAALWVLGCGGDFSSNPQEPCEVTCPAGPQGVEGSPGSQGPQGLPGEDGYDVVSAGQRLAPWSIIGADPDKSRMPLATLQALFPEQGYASSDAWDNTRAEVCAYRKIGVDYYCLPPKLYSTDWFTFAEPDCTGDPVFVWMFRPASYPIGTSIVEFADGSVVMGGDEVPTFYTTGGNGTEPCHEFVPLGDGFPKPWRRYIPFDEAAFVLGAPAL
jgi:hypothetical protein